MNQDQCEACSKKMPSFDTVHYGSIDQGYRLLCTQCFNTEVIKQSGLDDFENIQLEPIGLTDCSGEKHQFHFRTRLLGKMVSLEAFELRKGDPAGYQFQFLGKPDDDLFGLLAQLILRIRKALSEKHIEDSDYGYSLINSLVRGRIEWDPEQDGRVPIMVIDGREISWEEFGRLLMTREGSPFKLEIFDPSDEV